MLFGHRLDTLLDLRSLNRSPVGCMILALKGGVDSVVGSGVGRHRVLTRCAGRLEPDVVLDQFELDFDEPGCSTDCVRRSRTRDRFEVGP